MKFPKIAKRRRKAKMTVRGMHYQCETCGEERMMWLQTGLEEPKNPNSKPVPYITACPVCGGCFKHVRWNDDIHLPSPLKIGALWSRFERRRGHDCGVAVFPERDDAS